MVVFVREKMSLNESVLAGEMVLAEEMVLTVVAATVYDCL